LRGAVCLVSKVNSIVSRENEQLWKCTLFFIPNRGASRDLHLSSLHDLRFEVVGGTDDWRPTTSFGPLHSLQKGARWLLAEFGKAVRDETDFQFEGSKRSERNGVEPTVEDATTGTATTGTTGRTSVDLLNQ
jgi:hypothetical protein